MNSKLETENSKLRVAIYGGSGYGGSDSMIVPSLGIEFNRSDAMDQTTYRNTTDSDGSVEVARAASFRLRSKKWP